MSDLNERIKDKDLLRRIMDPEEVISKIFPKKGIIAFGGMGGTAYPKVIPKALYEYITRYGINFDYIIYNGGSTGTDFDEYISKINIKRRYPLGASSENLRKLVNLRTFEVSDLWLYEYSRWIRLGVFERKLGKIDVAIIEATGITEDGGIIPSLSVDATPSFIEATDKIVVELSIIKPQMLGIHDIYLPPLGSPIPIKNPLDRVGALTYKVPKSKIAAIVISEYEDSERIHYSKGSEIDRKVSENVISFLNEEIEKDPNLKSEYVTLQPGAGPIAGLLAEKIPELKTNLSIWGEVASTRWLPALSENVKGISCSVLYTLPGDKKYRDLFYEEFENFKNHIVLRSYEIANNPQIMLRFIHITIQQAIEIDLFGHANISHIGNNLYGGVGGSGDHTRPSYLTIIALPSITSSGLPRIVPFTNHVDIPEHDVDVVVTEQGWADLRLLSPMERAKVIINKCAHPNYKDLLEQYLDKLSKEKGHEPINFTEALSFKKLFSQS
jgi:acyl-CoA hydrolase